MRSSTSQSNANAAQQQRLPPFGMPPANLLVNPSQQQPQSPSSFHQLNQQRNNMLVSGMSNSSLQQVSAFTGLLSQQNLKSSFSNGSIGDSEFPSLNIGSSNTQSRSPMMFHGGGMSQSNQLYGNPSQSVFTNSTSKESQRPAYAQLMKHESSIFNPPREEFHIANEDFPALTPNANNASGINSTNIDHQVNSLNDVNSSAYLNHSMSNSDNTIKSQFRLPQSSAGTPLLNTGGGSFGGPNNPNSSMTPLEIGSQQSSQPPNGGGSQMKVGIQTHSNGRVSNIPRGMLSDQFGMAGLLTFLRAIETDPGIVALALGHDLTTLGLNLNAQEKNLYQSFGGPWQDLPCRPQNIDVHIPEEYATNAVIKEKLPPIKLNRFHEDLLFYLFYNYPGELYQLAAASELYTRDWRYHRDERVWITRIPHSRIVEQTAQMERGEYYVFDPNMWKKLIKVMTLEYTKLDERPVLPQIATGGPQQQQHMLSAGQQVLQHHYLHSKQLQNVSGSTLANSAEHQLNSYSASSSNKPQNSLLQQSN